MVSKWRVKWELRKLGSEEGDVAVSLIIAGAKGDRGVANSCPVAQYLKKRFPGELVSVTGSFIRVDGVEVKPPSGVRHFINAFDVGRFPTLEER